MCLTFRKTSVPLATSPRLQKSNITRYLQKDGPNSFKDLLCRRLKRCLKMVLRLEGENVILHCHGTWNIKERLRSNDFVSSAGLPQRATCQGEEKPSCYANHFREQLSATLFRYSDCIKNFGLHRCKKSVKDFSLR